MQPLNALKKFQPSKTNPTLQHHTVPRGPPARWNHVATQLVRITSTIYSPPLLHRQHCAGVKCRWSLWVSLLCPDGRGMTCWVFRLHPEEALALLSTLPIQFHSGSHKSGFRCIDKLIHFEREKYAFLFNIE